VLQVHDYSYGPGGLMWESNPTTIYTPGFGHRSNGVNTFYHHDWIGSTRYTSDISGNTFPGALRYDAFGSRSATGGTPYHPTDMQFAGDYGYPTGYANWASEPGLPVRMPSVRVPYRLLSGRGSAPVAGSADCGLTNPFPIRGSIASAASGRRHQIMPP
jgi:hypothetical protein